jgi:hypothetical protein
MTVGLSDPVPTTVNNAFQINEDNGWPNVEARIALAQGPLQGEGLEAKRPFEVGVSGVVGQIRTTQGATRVVADIWGVGTDLRCSSVKPSARTAGVSCRTPMRRALPVSTPLAVGRKRITT